VESKDKLCLAKFIPHRDHGIGSCNNCDGKRSEEKKCYHRTPWNIEEEEVLERQDHLAAALGVLKSIHDFLGEVIRDGLMENIPRVGDLADDVWNVLHWGDKIGGTDGSGK
jgi:hypothetical protein